MNNNDNSDNTLAIVIVFTMILAGLYFSPFWNQVVKYCEDGIGLGVGLVLTYSMYKTIKNRTYQEPQLKYVETGITSIFLYSLMIGIVLLPLFYYVLMVPNKPFFIALNGLGFQIFYFGTLLLGIGIFLLTLKKVMKMNKIPDPKKLLAKPTQSFDLKPYTAFNFDEVKKVEIQKCEFEDYKILKDKKGNLKVKLKDIPENQNLEDDFKIYEAEVKWRSIKNKDDMVATIFEEDIFIEKKPIYIFDTEKYIKRVNPLIFLLIEDKFNKPKLTVIPYLDLIKRVKEEPENEVLYVYNLLIIKLYKNYKKAAGKKAINIEVIFKRFDNVIEFVILELTNLCTISLTNFALGQLSRFQKNNKEIREMMGAIDNVSSFQVKSCGIQLYQFYLLYKIKKGYIKSPLGAMEKDLLIEELNKDIDLSSIKIGLDNE